MIDGGQTVTDLRGHVHPGDTVEARFTVPAGSTDTLSLVSYTAPQAYFDASTAGQQQVYRDDTETFGAGDHTMTVQVPNSNFQVDFVCGQVITHFGPAGSNNFYSPQGRLISADNGGPSGCDTGGHGGSGGSDHGKGGNDRDRDRGGDRDRSDHGKGGSVCDPGGKNRDDGFKGLSKWVSSCDTGRGGDDSSSSCHS